MTLRPMNNFHYVYVLQSLSFPDEHYTGQTADLAQRLKAHNAGKAHNYFCWVNNEGSKADA